jgi:hypothetical protein
MMLSRNKNDTFAAHDANNLVKMKLSFQYSDLKKTFNEFVANILSKHDSQDLAIDTQNISLFFESFYNLSKNELKTLKEYLNKHLKNEFIISSKSICATSILFIKKKTSELYLCVDYRELNALIVKNRYSFSLISEALNRIIDAQYFIKLDIIAAYNKIRIKKNKRVKNCVLHALRHVRISCCFFRSRKCIDDVSNVYQCRISRISRCICFRIY